LVVVLSRPACTLLYEAQEPEFCFFTSNRAFNPETQNLEVPLWGGGPDESWRMMAASPILFGGKKSESQRMASKGMALGFLVVISARGPSLGTAK